MRDYVVVPEKPVFSILATERTVSREKVSNR